MDKKRAEDYAKRGSDSIEQELFDFFQLSFIEKLELIQSRLDTNVPDDFKNLLKQVIKDFKREMETPDSQFNFGYIESIMSDIVTNFNISIYRSFLDFCVLLSLFGIDKSPLFSVYKEQMLKDNNLTPKKLKEALLAVFAGFLIKPKHGGKNSFWNNNKKLEFLACYNRFLIVIKNARRDKRTLKRKNKLSIKVVENEIIEKYEIPPTLKNSLFSDDAPSDVALDWAISQLNLENFNRDYLDNTILREARSLWNQETILIDILINYGIVKYYGVNKHNKAENDELKYSCVEKNPKLDTLAFFEKKEKFLVNFSFSRL